MADYDLTLTPVKRASFDAGRKFKFYDDELGAVAAVVKDLDGNVLTQPIRVPSDGHLDLRFDQWPVYYASNRAWTRIMRVPGMPAAITVAFPGLTASAAELNKLDGGSVTNAELNLNDGAAGLCSFVVATGAANTADVTVQVNDAAGVPLARACMIDVWLSSDAGGLALATAHDTMAVKAAGGTLMGSLTANKVLKVLTKADGSAVISVVDAGKAAFFINAKADGPVAAFSTGTITAGTDYGA